MKTNVELFEYSLQHPEPLVDDYYVKPGDLIIAESPEHPNILMTANQELRDQITAFRIALQQNNNSMQKDILETIQGILRNKSLNVSEFASFWAVFDVSYSAYSKLPNEEQLVFLDSTINKYLKMRHGVYTRHGYSATTLQVGMDAKSHKKSGELGGRKNSFVLSKYGYTKLADLSLDAFMGGNKIFLFSDKTGKNLFKKILEKFNIKFKWSSKRQNKMPDILFKNGSEIYIVEHKHTKEGGGGQNKQISEIIDFISHSDSGSVVPIHYVTFMDGRYFNLLVKRSRKKGKLQTQIKNIRKNLRSHTGNYFVNTAGFIELLKQL